MKSIYPRHFQTPEGTMVPVTRMALALKTIRANREADYPGWNWFATPGRMILKEFRRGMHDRINRRLANENLEQGQ